MNSKEQDYGDLVDMLAKALNSYMPESNKQERLTAEYIRNGHIVRYRNDPLFNAQVSSLAANLITWKVDDNTVQVTGEQIAIKETAALLKPMQDFEAAKRADLQVVDEPDWSHPKLQALLSTKARQSMIISLAESLLDGDDDWTGTDWDYEHDIHRKIRKLMDGTTVTDEQQPAAWLHSARPEADVITDAVKRVWENIPPKMEQYSIPLYTRKQSSAEANAVQVTDENYTPGRKYDTQNGFKADIRYLVNGYLCGHIRCEEAATGIITFHWTLDGMVMGADSGFDLVHPRAALQPGVK